MNYKRLNDSGIAHLFAMLLVVVVVACFGVYFLVASHASTPTVMYDSADPRRIPAKAKVVASYVGSQSGYKIAQQKFPKAILISINETPSSNDAADIWGIEPGAKTIAQTIKAIADGTAHGAYGVSSDLNAVRAGLNERGIARSSYVLWLSGAGTQNFKSIPSGYDAHQYKYVAGQYDVSTISATFLSTLNKAKDSKAAKSIAKKHGRITFTTLEQITSDSGKKSYKRSGLIKLKVVSASSKAMCRHLNVKFVPKKLSDKRFIVYEGHGDTAKGTNLGKIHLTSCSTGVYRIIPELGSKYNLVSVTSPIKVKKGRNTQVKVIVTRQSATASAADADSTSDQSDSETLQTVPVNPSNPDEGIGNNDPAANTDPGQ